MQDEMITGTIGCACGVVGTATQVNETLRTISLILTIIGAVITYIIVPIVAWHKNAKKDGKITADEANEALRKIAEGASKVKEAMKENEAHDQREEIEKKEGNKHG